MLSGVQSFPSCAGRKTTYHVEGLVEHDTGEEGRYHGAIHGHILEDVHWRE
jgi:hypothetical protein